MLIQIEINIQKQLNWSLAEEEKAFNLVFELITPHLASQISAGELGLDRPGFDSISRCWRLVCIYNIFTNKTKTMQMMMMMMI